MKIVINKCYGGYGLSRKAIIRYAELKGIKLYGYVHNIAIKVYCPKIPDEKRPEIMPYETFLSCAKETPTHPYITYTTKPVKTEKELNKYYFSVHDINRTDPILVRVIRELKKEANGHLARLEIMEIPSNIEWTIEEYDGMEHIAEKHRTWG